MKRSVWSAVALAIAAVGPVACSEVPEQPAETAGPEGVAVTNARLMLPAVKGNPGAVYFDVANTGSGSRVIRAVEVEGAGSAMMHVMVDGAMQDAAQMMVGPGETVKLEPGGRHVMAMGLADTVTAGSSADVTLTFVGGAKMSFPAEVRAAGDER
jgi:copper(I)-binding protein